jgi:putative endonuclease
MFPMKITEKRFTGNIGEALAAKYLKSKGFIVIGQNYALPYGEIDLIAQKGGVIHFIEVKAVTCEIAKEGVPYEMSLVAPNPADRIDKRKLGRIGKAAKTFMAAQRLEDLDWQIDGALVYIDEQAKRAKVEILENIGAEA